MKPKKTKDDLIARTSMRHRDDEQGKIYEVQAGQRVPRDHLLVALNPGQFFVATDKLVALETLTAHDAEGNLRTVEKGEALSPGDPFIDLHPGMVGRPSYELEEESA